MFLVSNRSQMMSKCGKNKQVAHEARSLTFLPHFDVFYDLLLNRRTAIWNLFYIIKETNYDTKRFLCRRLFTLVNTKKAIWRNLVSIQNEVISLVAMRSKIIVLIDPRKSRHCQTWLGRHSSWNENLQQKQIWTAKSVNLEENAWKVSFCHQSSPVSLGRCLE